MTNTPGPYGAPTGPQGQPPAGPGHTGPYGNQPPGQGQPVQRGPVPSQQTAPGQPAAQPQGPAQPYPAQPRGLQPQQPPQQPPLVGAQPHMPRPAGNFASQPTGFPAPQPKKKRKLGLILGISIPVTVVVIGAIIAAIAVPKVLLEQRASQAAQQFHEERAAWAAVFSQDALAPYTNYDSTAVVDAWNAYNRSVTLDFDTYAPSSGDTAALTEACTQANTAATNTATLAGVTPPAQPAVEGAENNAEYAAALQQWQQEQAAYAASATLAEDLTTEFTNITNLCNFITADAGLVSAWSSSYQSFMSGMEYQEGGALTVSTGANSYIDFECSWAFGCPKWDDGAARADAGNLWDASVTQYHSDRAALFSDQCPTADLADVCAAAASMESNLATLSAAIGTGFRTDDPVANVVAGNGAAVEAWPTLNDAFNAYINASNEYPADVTAATAALGALDVEAALGIAFEMSAERIRQAAATVSVAP